MTKIQDYLSLAIKIAESAGSYLAKHKTAGKVIHANKAHDLKLSADRLSERQIIQSLKKNTAFSILSEEAGMIEGKDQEFYWIVDPLDGTINYFHQIPLTCVSIALYRKQTPVLGVIYDFTRKELFSALVGQGAYLNKRKIHVSAFKDKRQAVIATGFPSQTSLSRENLATFCKHVQTYKKVRLLGTAALSMAYVACGRLDAYTEKDIMLWDVAAGIAIVQAAGGKIQMRAMKRSYSYEIKASNGCVEI